jgi:hypothetical protein
MYVLLGVFILLVELNPIKIENKHAIQSPELTLYNKITLYNHSPFKNILTTLVLNQEKTKYSLPLYRNVHTLPLYRNAHTLPVWYNSLVLYQGKTKHIF